MNPDEQRTSCPGFLDEFGIWNNGFECPPLSGQIRICCGTDSRRVCCSLENFSSSSLNRHGKSLNETTFSFIENLNFTFLTLPILLTCILIIILVLLSFVIILFLCYRYRKQNQSPQEQNSSTKQTLFTDHFPFSPPHHQLFFNENNHQTCLLHPQTKDTVTTTATSASSSSSTRIPSDIYFNDWKEYLPTTNEQPMNRYPTISSHNNDHLSPHSNYLLHTKHQQEDIIV